MITRLNSVLVALVISGLPAAHSGDSCAAPPTRKEPQVEKTTQVENMTPGELSKPVQDSTKPDSDGDGVANDLETHGYTYDPEKGHFKAWEGERDVKHWFTDPMQWSTDQDAFSDGMEASGAMMDVAVRGPGDDPLVPAYPNIVVQLMGYSVTLNEEITYTDGESLAKGSTWNRETAQTSSRASEMNWEVGVESKAEFGTTGASASVSYHANLGGPSPTRKQQATP